MTFVFRADASPAMGAGHVMRTLSIAEALCELSFEVALVGSIIEVPWLSRLIRDSVFGSISSPVGFKPTYEDVLIIDSYNLPVTDKLITETTWKARACLVDRITPQYVADVYFNTAPIQTWFQNTMRASVPIFFGIEYIPVRQSFDAKISKDYKSPQICKVICVAGGSDPTNLAASFRKVLIGLDDEFDATIFTNEYLKNERKIAIRPIGPDFHEELQLADLVLTAAGTTVWELLQRRIPFGVACAAQNQRDNYSYLTKHNLALPLGEYSSDWILDINAIRDLILDSNLRQSLIRNADELNFGQGAINIAKELIAINNL